MTISLYAAAANGGGSWTSWAGTGDGSSTRFETGTLTATTLINSCNFDTNKTLVLYRYNSTIKSAVITTNGTSVSSIGLAATVYASGSSSFSCATLDSGRVIVCYADNGGDLYGVVLSISDTTIAVGGATLLDSNTSDKIYVITIDTDKCVVVFADSTASDTKARCFTVSSTTVNSPGSAEVVVSSTAVALSAAPLTASTALVAYATSGSTGRSKILSISGTSVIAGTQAVFSTNAATQITAAALSSTTVIVGYNDLTLRGSFCALGVSGTTIAPGLPVVFDSNGAVTINASAGGSGITKIDSSTALLPYSLSSPARTYGIVCTVSGTSTTAYTRVQKLASNSAYQTAVTLDSSRVLMFYDDATSSSRGTAVVLKS